MFKRDVKFYFFVFLAAVHLAACGQKSGRTTFGEICDRENQTEVELEGYLRLPGATNEEIPFAPDYTYLLLVEKANGTGGFLYALVKDAKTREPNRMKALPASYTYADFHVFANDGAEISADERVKITGEVVRKKNLCVLKINKIEAP